MSAKKRKITKKELRDRIQALGITAESAGCPIEELVERAEQNEYPMDYLAIHANSVLEGLRDRGEGLGEEEKPEPIAPLSVTLHVPLGPDVEPEGYVSPCIRDRGGHVDIQLDRPQALTLARLFAGLDASDARLKNERRIQSQADVVRWLLEQIGEGVTG